MATSMLLSLAMAAGGGQALEPFGSNRWFYEPIKAQYQSCSAFGEEHRVRLRAILKTAQVRTKGFLSATAWEAIIAAPPSPARAGTREELSGCEQFAAEYGDPRLSWNLRANLAYGLIGQQPIACAAWFPDLAPALRKAWFSALRRNGLPTYETLFDDLVESNWRKDDRPAPENQFAPCAETLGLLASPKFDEFVSEGGTKRMMER